jgi:hypothetical protein
MRPALVPSTTVRTAESPPVFVMVLVEAVQPRSDTVPPPAAGGVAQVPSPRQNVDELAAVPLFRFATGRLPVTSEARSTVCRAELRVVSWAEDMRPGVDPSTIGITNPSPAELLTVRVLAVYDRSTSPLCRAELRVAS